MNQINLSLLQDKISCPIYTDNTTLILYSTDASAYRERPLAVVLPDNLEDIKQIIGFCASKKINLIVRGAGTSLAGQVVGEGIVMDISKNFNNIIEINAKDNYAIVEPGVVRDVLNTELKKYNKFFAPETSTSNRCTIGGMVGNNSCGLHSVAWGTTRDNIISLECILADGSVVNFHRLSKQEFIDKTKQNDLEGEIYRLIDKIVSDKNLSTLIKKNFPSQTVIRRNNGYALDELLDENFIDVCKLIAGSEGTLCYITKIKLKIMDLPSDNRAAICIHFNSLQESFVANLHCLKFLPIAVELMDDNIIAAAKRNAEQSENLFFVKGDPKAILVDELCKPTAAELEEAINNTIASLKTSNLGYEYVVVRGNDIKRVWELRKAGLGLLTNVPGDNKPVSVIEDTAVAAQDLPKYMAEFGEILDRYDLKCVYHAHIASGELHLRPVLNLKTKKDIALFRKVATDVATLVKKYHGSLSGEHGDGRLRGEFIPFMYGEEVYQLMKEVKYTFDKDNIFNRGKIIDTPPMDIDLRYDAALKTNTDEKNNPYKIKTYYNFDKEYSFLQAIEQCNGAGVCRKDSVFGGTMCPSFHANDNDEKFSTRARANILREIFATTSPDDAFASKEIKQLLDECLMCKGCKRECPSNVDMTKLKSEFLQHYYDKKGTPLNVLLMSYLPMFERMGSVFPSIYNFFISNKFSSSIIKNIMHFAPQRSLPTLQSKTFNQKYNKWRNDNDVRQDNYVYLLADEFSNFQDSHIAEKFLLLLSRLGYEVRLAPVSNCGRILFSKGLIKRAKRLAKKNIENIKDLICDNHPLIGIEPSAILSFRDEYPLLIEGDISHITRNCLCFDEFIYCEMQKGNIRQEQFTDKEQEIIYHTHCQQKAIIGEKYMQAILSLPTNYKATAIHSGCCGMAGSFGYEKKHYATSEKIVHDVIAKHIAKASLTTIVCASGTSCREQISHFTEKKPLHPIEILYDALK